MTDLTTNEARVIIYLDQVKEPQLRYPSYISAKLNIDRMYCYSILKRLIVNKWARIEDYNVKSYYFLTRKAPLAEAKKLLAKRK